MGVKAYDEALVAKVSKWWPEGTISILKPNETSRLWGIQADNKKDQPLTLPLVVISRDPSMTLDISTRRPLSCRGRVLYSDKDKTIELNAIPFHVNYQIDIYTGGIDPISGQPIDGYELGDEYVRNAVFNLVNHPKLEVEIPYNGVNIKHVANIFLEQNITDNSDVPEKKFPDQFTRWTIRFTINDAYLFSVPVKTSATLVGAELQVLDIQPGDDDISVEYSAPGYEKE